MQDTVLWRAMTHLFGLNPTLVLGVIGKTKTELNLLLIETSLAIRKLALVYALNMRNSEKTHVQSSKVQALIQVPCYFLIRWLVPFCFLSLACSQMTDPFIS